MKKQREVLRMVGDERVGVVIFDGSKPRGRDESMIKDSKLIRSRKVWEHKGARFSVCDCFSSREGSISKYQS